ncbi:MAG: VWA domain-containing protein [Cyclobacteriaceae bacterium]|nr:VWA domain-containing protein [Cyclobacteriaceae bacterium]
MKNTTTIFGLFLLFLISCHSNEEDALSPYANASYSLYSGNSIDMESTAQGESYNEVVENPFINTKDEPVSTFSIDADGGSYSNARRFILQENQLPPDGAVRTEEFINYFNLDYQYQSSTHPISLNGEVATCPWTVGNKLIRIGIQGKPLSNDQFSSSNFVLLIDVSGSMSSSNKLELLKEGFNMFVDEMDDNDKVAIVTYAGSAGVILQSTSGTEKQKIKDAISSLGSGGSTAGAQGIITAYEIAQENFIENGNNRIILGTDGDFNVGISSQEELVQLIETKRDEGIFLTVLGVGSGNYNEAVLEQIANHGNGTYEYIDNVNQLKKVFVYEYSKFYTVAKDVKVQVEFNPTIVQAYRLIGYENRLLNQEDFEDDKKDAGEIGADQNITALYEIIPMSNAQFRTDPTFTIDFRYKEPDSDTSIPLQLEIFDEGRIFEQSSKQMIFTSSVAAFSMLLIESDYIGNATYHKVLSWEELAGMPDPYGFKQEFRIIVNKAATL